MTESLTIGSEDPEELFHALVEIVDGLLVARRTFVIIERPRNRFVQALADVDGSLQIETVSNEFLEPSARLTPGDEARLLHMGWRPPGDHTPNWHRTFVEPWPWPAPSRPSSGPHE